MRKVLLSTLLSALPLLCQTAQLSGLIKDSSDAAVPNAKLTVTNQETGVNRVTESNGVGVTRRRCCSRGCIGCWCRRPGSRA